MKKYDVVIIGAGAAGLMTARLLSGAGLSVAVLEAQEVAGGRIRTVYKGFSKPVEAGAEFIHGRMPLTFNLIREYGLTTIKRKGKMVRVSNTNTEKQKDFISSAGILESKLKEVKTDISIAEFIATFLQGKEFEEIRESLKLFVEGYDAADIDLASTLAFRDEWMKGDDDQYMIKEGYHALISSLVNDVKSKSCDLYFNTEVTAIEWQRDNVKVIACQEFYCEKVVVTVSPAILLSGKISFTPEIPSTMKEFSKLGTGSVIKLLMEFDTPFWKGHQLNGTSLNDLGWIFSDRNIPTWWTQNPEDNNLLTGWLGGPKVKKYMHSGDEDIIKDAFASLNSIFHLAAGTLENNCRSVFAANWQNDPYTLCAYSYDTINGREAKNKLTEALDDTVYFAGEALSAENTGTVEAAFETANNTASRILVLHITK